MCKRKLALLPVLLCLAGCVAAPRQESTGPFATAPAASVSAVASATAAPSTAATTAATTAAAEPVFTGWKTEDGRKFYYLEDGSPANGQAVLDGKTHYFSSQGEEILLVNPWNYLQSDYDPDLVISAGGGYVTRECDPALRQMLADCQAAGYETVVCSAYRSQAWQEKIYNVQIQTQMYYGLSYEEAVIAAGKVVAVPGTSEHQLGLALDIMDADYQYLDEKQADMPAQKWLMEHCWEYGFILRYPEDKTQITGIIYEPWHYRYVGRELAAELKDLGLCLEEYIDMLTAASST